MEMLSEQLALVATIDPVSQGAGTVYTDAIDMSCWERVLFVLSVGVMGSSSTVDFGVCEGATTSPTTVISGKSITQLTDASTDDNKQVIVEVRADELDPANRYVRGKLTVGTAASLVSVVALGTGYHKPASDYDLASVDEIVA